MPQLNPVALYFTAFCTLLGHALGDAYIGATVGTGLIVLVSGLK